jgi:hypothetical protein
MRSELARLRKLRRDFTVKPPKPVQNIEAQPMTDEEWAAYQAVAIVAGELGLKAPHLGIRAGDLPSMLSQAQFQEYLEHKRTLNPTNQFWQDEAKVQAWLLTKGVKVKT